MELTECIKTRRSIRRYENGTVGREELRQMIEAAIMAPSWKNSQTSRFYVTASEEKTAAFKECLPEFNRRNTENASTYIVSTVVNGISGFEKDGSYTSHLKDGWQFFDNGLQIENLCLRACELGLGTLIMGIYDEAKIREFFNIPSEEIVTAVVSVGHAAVAPGMPKRKSVDEVTTFAE